MFQNKITCKKCNKQFPIETMNLDKYGDMMVCHDCFGKQFKREPKKMVTKDGSFVIVKPESGSLSYSEKFGLTTKKEREMTRMTTPEEMIAYKCAHCHYEFERRKSFPFKGKCPYCNRGRVVLDPIKSGQWVEKLW